MRVRRFAGYWFILSDNGQKMHAYCYASEGPALAEIRGISELASADWITAEVDGLYAVILVGATGAYAILPVKQIEQPTPGYGVQLITWKREEERKSKIPGELYDYHNNLVLAIDAARLVSAGIVKYQGRYFKFDRLSSCDDLRSVFKETACEEV